MKKATRLCLPLLAIASKLHCANTVWTNGAMDNDLANTLNWSTSSLPTNLLPAEFGLGASPGNPTLSAGSLTCDMIFDATPPYTLDIAGTLNFNSSGITSSQTATFNVSSGGQINFSNSASTGATVFSLNGGSITFTDISDAGSSSIFLAGSSTLSATNGLRTFGAITSDNTGNILINGTLTIDNTGSQTIACPIPNIGVGTSLTKQGTGTLVLTGMNTYAGVTTIVEGTISLSGAGSLLSTGRLAFLNSPSTATFDISAASGSCTIGNLTAGFGNGVINLGSNNLIVGTSTDSFFGGLIQGSGAIIKQGFGQLDLLEPNTYSGGTSLSAGTLLLQNSNALGTGTLAMSNGTTFRTLSSLSVPNDITLNGACTIQNPIFGTATLSGTISSTGTLLKTGTGTLALTGANTYSGGTQVLSGTLSVIGSVSSDVFVSASGALKGTGSITGNVSTDGIISPGGSIGTLTVGSATFNSGSTFQLEISPTASDLLNSTGPVTILSDVTLQVIPQSGIYPRGEVFTILNAGGGVTGTFDSVTTGPNLPLISVSPIYSPNQIEIAINFADFSAVVNRGNPGAAAKSLNGVNPSPGSDLATVFAQLDSLNTKELYQAFNQIQPSLLIDFSLAQQNQFMMISSLLRKRTSALYASACPCAYDLTEWNIWGDISADFVHQGSESYKGYTNYGFHSDAIAGSLGIDYLLPGDVILGLLGAYTYGEIDWNHSRAHGHSNSYYGGIYAGWLNQLFFINLSAIGTYNSYEDSRRIRFGDIDRHARGNHNGAGFLGHLDLGFTLPKEKKIQVYPFGQIDYIYLHEDHYKEHHADSLNLHISERNSNLLRSELGLQTRFCMNTSKGLFIPTIKLSWVNETRFTGEDLRARLEDVPQSFQVKGISPNRNLIAPGVGLTGMFFEDRLNISLNYEGEFGEKIDNNMVNLSFLWNF